MTSCAVCTNFAALHHRIAVNEVLASTKGGCPECKLLLRIVSSFHKLYGLTIEIQWTVERSLHITLLGLRKQTVGTLEVYVDPNVESPWPAIGSGRNVCSEPWGPSRIDLARRWLRDCDTSHSICPRLQPRLLPTRVLDVGGDDHQMLLRAGNDEVARYIALSHCWGGHVPVQTTKDTLQNHFEAVNLDSSSQTFLDAAQVCRDLGIRYLWIDSLCIVQDDEDDWAREAGKMSEVYRNAILTISAEGARNAKEGLFKQPETTICEQKNIDWKTSSGDPITLHVRLRGQSDHGPEAIGHFAHSSSETLHSELSDRAWVLQERLLSTRNIHFFSEEMAWSCCSVSRCECRIDADVTDMSVFKKLNVESASRPLIVEEMHREWTNLVMEFTRRKLTKIKDRLPAISGLAKLCGEVTLSKYYAGLFDHDLEYGLLWMSDYHAQSFLIYRNPKRPHMPTWSWASTTGPVKYFDRQRNQFERRTHGATVEPRFKVLEAEVSSRGSNLYSDVDRGMLKIKGQLLRVHYDKTKCHFRPWDETLASHMLPADIPFSTADLHTQDATTAEVSHMFPSTDPSKNQTLQLPQKAKTRQPQIIPDVLAEPPDMARTNEWYFLRAARYIPGGIYAYESSENVCLLLERLGAEAGMGLFKRRCFVLYGFPSKPFWEEEWAPTQMLGIV